VAHMHTLVTKRHGVLQLLRIEHPPLGAANTPSIRQIGHTARVVEQRRLIPFSAASSEMLRHSSRRWIISRSRPNCVRRALGWLCMGA